MVLVKEDEPAPRTQWMIGKDIEIVTGQDIAFKIAENSSENNCSDERKVTNENEAVKHSDVHETEPDYYRRPTRKSAIDGENAQRLRDLYYN